MVRFTSPGPTSTTSRRARILCPGGTSSPVAKHQRTRRLGRAQPSVAAQAAPPLLVAGGAKEPFGDAVQLAIALPSGRGKVIHHQQRVLGVEGQPL